MDKKWWEGQTKRGLVRLLAPLLGPGTVKSVDLQAIRTVLIVKTEGWVGDAVMATPAIQALWEGLPHAKLDLVTRPDLAPLFERDPRLRRVWRYDKRTLRRQPLTLLSWVKGIRAERYDLVMVLSAFSYSVTSVGLAALSGARYRVGFSGRTFGYPDMSERLMTTVVEPLEESAHEVRRHLALVRAAGMPAVSERHHLAVSKDRLADAKAFFRGKQQASGALVGFHLGSRKRHQCWPMARFLEVGNRLTEQGHTVVLSIGPGEEDLEQGYLRGAIRPPVVVKVPLGELGAYLACLQTVVCVDTGVLHVAAGVGVPTVGIFVEGDPDRWGPIGPEHCALRAILHQPESVSVGQVLNAINKVLSFNSLIANKKSISPQV